MKSTSLVLWAASALVGCTVNSASPTTAWGKQGVSMLDYRTDGGQCAVLAVTSNSSASGSNTAGGINGANGAPPPTPAASAPPAGGAGGGNSSSVPSVGGSTYRDSASADFVNRAAMQQRAQEMNEQRARNDALKSCLVSRGYTEFALTAAQRAELAKLPQGSEERRTYLYKLGTDPAVLEKQSIGK